MIRRGVKCSGSWMLHNVPAEDPLTALWRIPRLRAQADRERFVDHPSTVGPASDPRYDQLTRHGGLRPPHETQQRNLAR